MVSDIAWQEGGRQKIRMAETTTGGHVVFATDINSGSLPQRALTLAIVDNDDAHRKASCFNLTHRRWPCVVTVILRYMEVERERRYCS